MFSSRPGSTACARSPSHPLPRVYGANTKIPFSESDPVVSPISPTRRASWLANRSGTFTTISTAMDVVMLRFSPSMAGASGLTSGFISSPGS